MKAIQPPPPHYLNASIQEHYALISGLWTFAAFSATTVFGVFFIEDIFEKDFFIPPNWVTSHEIAPLIMVLSLIMGFVAGTITKNCRQSSHQKWDERILLLIATLIEIVTFSIMIEREIIDTSFMYQCLELISCATLLLLTAQSTYYLLSSKKNACGRGMVVQRPQPSAVIEKKLPRNIGPPTEETYKTNKFGLYLRNVAIALAAKKYKRLKKGGELNAYVVDHSHFDAFLEAIKLQKQALKAEEKLSFQFTLRIRGEDGRTGHFVFGEVLATANSLDFLIADPQGIRFPELLGKGYQYLPWQTNNTNFIEKIKLKFSEIPSFTLFTNLETLQTALYGCAYFSTFGCFDLSSLESEQLPKKGEENHSTVFDYMRTHTIVEEDEKKSAKDNPQDYTEPGWNAIISNSMATPILEDRKITLKDHYQALRKSGAQVSRLPDHNVRNQQLIGISNASNLQKFSSSEIKHYRGLFARAVHHQQRGLNKKGQTLRQSLLEHTDEDGQNNRLQAKVQRLKVTIQSFFNDSSLSSEEKARQIEERIWRPGSFLPVS